jgi:hypothetical protein
MPGQYRCLPVFLFVALGAASSQAAEKSESICTSGDVVRRVVVEVGDLNSGLPCEVVYWKDNEAPGERRVLWNARSDASFCDGKAAGLVDKLATAGWNCGNGSTAADAAATPSTPPAPAIAATAAGTGASPSEAITSTGQVPSTAQTAATANIEPAATAPSSAAAPSSIAPSATAGLTDGIEAAPTAPSAGSAQELQTAAIEPAAPASPATPVANSSLDQLQTVIDANLASLNQTVDGDFQAKIGDFGDLDSDGIQDAVVFFNYESSTADFTQFVAAYLFDGKSYRLAATKPVGGTDLAVRQVDVEEIVDGSIQLRLVLNDAAQSENRRAAMILKDGQLIEIQ